VLPSVGPQAQTKLFDQIPGGQKATCPQTLPGCHAWNWKEKLGAGGSLIGCPNPAGHGWQADRCRDLPAIRSGNRFFLSFLSSIKHKVPDKLPGAIGLFSTKTRLTCIL
jgi:hypothetical protein